MFKMNKPNKRKRSVNWLEEDKTLLKELVKTKVAAIENKNTDTNSNQRKKKAWLEIEESFNTLCHGATRNVTQLKSQWTLTKIMAKKASLLHRRLFRLNGGAPKPPELPENDIHAWLPNKFGNESNEFGSKAVVTNTNVSQIVEHLQPIKIEKDAEEPIEQILIPRLEDKPIEQILVPRLKKKPMEKLLISRIEENYLGTHDLSSKNDILKKKKLPVLSQSAASSKIETPADIQHKNLDELHLIQMDNERKRSRNLDLEYEILLDKKKLMQRKLNDDSCCKNCTEL